MAVLADLTTRVHRRLPPAGYARRETDPCDHIHDDARRMSRDRRNEDFILPRQRQLLIEAAIEAVPRSRARVVDGTDTAVLERAPAPFRGPKSRARRFYTMKPGAEEGPLFNVIDRATGVVLGQCRGVHEHVRTEALRLAQSQGLNLSHVKIEVADDR